MRDLLLRAETALRNHDIEPDLAEEIETALLKPDQHAELLQRVYEVKIAIIDCFGESPFGSDGALLVPVGKYNELVEKMNDLTSRLPT